MHSSLTSVAIALTLGSLGAACQQKSSMAPVASSAPATAPVAAAPAAVPPAPAPTLASATSPTPSPTTAGPLAEVPAGSRLILRVEDTVDSSRMSPGQRFRASLDAALLDPSGKVVVPARTPVLGLITQTQSAGHVAGKSEVEIAFTDIEMGGVLYPMQSQAVKAVGEGSGGGTARKVAAGALIGGAIGGGKGAAQGAAVGGAAAILTRGKEVKIPRGTMLELSLAAPLRVPAPEGSAPSATQPATESNAVAKPATSEAAASKPAASGEPDKACVKKLMGSGFSADEAVASCKKESKK